MAKKSRTKRSRAAIKGWETRRRNARSRAAIKGWETRRRNLRKKKKKRIVRVERHVNVEYTLAKKNNPEIQISARGPRKKSREQIMAAVEEYLKTGKNPRGWRIRVVEWKKAGRTYAGDDTEKTRESILAMLQEPSTNVTV